MQRGTQENLWPKSFLSAPLRATSSVFFKASGVPFCKPNKIQGHTGGGIVGIALGRKDLLRVRGASRGPKGCGKQQMAESFYLYFQVKYLRRSKQSNSATSCLDLQSSTPSPRPHDSNLAQRLATSAIILEQVSCPSKTCALSSAG